MMILFIGRGVSLGIFCLGNFILLQFSKIYFGNVFVFWMGSIHKNFLFR